MPRPFGPFQILAGVVIAVGLPCHGASPKGVVQGRVTDAQGNPISGATVQIGRSGASTGNSTLYCGGGGVGADAPVWVQDIPLGGNDPCGDVAGSGMPQGAASGAANERGALRDERSVELAAWSGRKVDDLYTAKTDSQGHYRIEASGKTYEMVAFRPALADPLGAGRLGMTTGPLAHGSVDLSSGQTVTRDLVLLDPKDAARAAAADRPPPLPDRSAWPVVFDGGLKAGGSICLNMAAVPPDTSVRIGVAFQPPLKASEMSRAINGVWQQGRGSNTISGMVWVESGRIFDRSKTFKIAFRKPVTDAKVQVIGYTPGTGFGPAGVTLCK